MAVKYTKEKAITTAIAWKVLEIIGSLSPGVKIFVYYDGILEKGKKKHRQEKLWAVFDGDVKMRFEDIKKYLDYYKY